MHPISRLGALVGCVVAGVVVSHPGAASQPDLNRDRRNGDDMAIRLRELATQEEVPAGAVVMVRNDQTVLLDAFGPAAGGEPRVTRESVFPVASVSKVFTALTAARLVIAGRLSLDQDLRKGRDWLRGVAPGVEPVTLRQLLTHTAGFDDRFIGMFVGEEERAQPLGDYLRRRMPRRTTAPNGWARYSNHGVALAGLVIEEAAGRPFADAVQQFVLDPLRMSSTTFLEPLPDRFARRLVRAFPCPDATCQPLPIAHRHTTPAGAMVTTAADMDRFLRSALRPDESPIEPASVQLLLSRAWGHRPELPGIGLAVQEQPIAGHRALVHSGGSAGYKSLIALVPGTASGLFVVTAGGSSQFGARMLAWFEELLGAEARAMGDGRNVQALTRAELEEYTGSYLLVRAARATYESFPGRFLFGHTIKADADGYLNRSEGGVVRRYGRIDGDLFGAVDAPAVMAFERSAAGDIVELHAADVFFGARFPASYERLSPWAAPAFLNELLSWLVGLPVIAIMMWSGVEVVRAWRERRGNRGQADAAPSRTAMGWTGLLLTGIVVTCTLTFGFGFMARLNALAFDAPEALAQGLPGEIGRLLWLPWAIAISSLLLAGATIQAWVTRRTGRMIADRILMSVVSLCALGFVWLLTLFHMLPPTA